MAAVPTKTRLFTLEHANRMLPLISRIVEDVWLTYRGIAEREARLRRCRAGDGLTKMHLEEIEAFEESIREDRERLADYVYELTELGVFLKAIDVGGVSFPAVYRGRLVFLAWKLGETCIHSWHELDAGFAGRQSIDCLLPEIAGFTFQPVSEAV
jgi:hypothetical protein